MHCKKCDNERLKRYRKRIKEENADAYQRQIERGHNYYQGHKELYAQWAKEYADTHKEQYRESQKRYREKYPEKHKERTESWWNQQTPEEQKERRQKYYQAHKEYHREYEREHSAERYQWKKEWLKERRKNDPDFVFEEKIRGAIYRAFRHNNYYKSECGGMKTTDILGCSYQELKEYLAKTFKANYGYDYTPSEKVHIDHIVPLSTAQSREDMIRLNHYTNLQLLKPSDNSSKQARLDYPLRGYYFNAESC